MLRHSVQNDRENLDFFHCEGCRRVRGTCPSDRSKERLDRIIERVWPSPVCPLEFGPNHGAN
jgi:hypothetical protein